MGRTCRRAGGAGKIDLVAEAVELPKKFGVASGVGGHALDVVQACERHGVKADFYIKTFHNHSYPTAPKPEQIKGPLNEYPGYWCSNPQETADFMKGVAEAVDRLQDDGGGRDSAAAGLPPGVCAAAPTSCWPACSTSRLPKTRKSPKRRWLRIATASGPGGLELLVQVVVHGDRNLAVLRALGIGIGT